MLPLIASGIIKDELINQYETTLKRKFLKIPNDTGLNYWKNMELALKSILNLIKEIIMKNKQENA